MKKILTILVLLSLIACKTTEKQKQKQEQTDAGYEILYKINMQESIEFINMSPKGSAIELDYRAVGTQTRKKWDLKLVNMAKGPESASIVGKENVEFPCCGKITYQSNEGQAEMEFKIFEKGYWQIIMTTLSLE